MENDLGSCVRKIDGSYYENVDGMLLPISKKTAEAILRAITSVSQKNNNGLSSREGSSI